VPLIESMRSYGREWLDRGERKAATAAV
jgi:hypothetical protein